MRRSSRLFGWLLLIAVLGGWFVFVRPPALGGSTSYIILWGDSMQPTHDPGDLVVVRRSSSYQPGDVVAFRTEPNGTHVIHRIVDTSPDGYLLQGDNRSSRDPWRPTDDEIVGEAWFAIPGVGRYLLDIAASPVRAAAVSGTLTSLMVLLPPWGARRPRAKAQDANDDLQHQLWDQRQLPGNGPFDGLHRPPPWGFGPAVRARSAR